MELPVEIIGLILANISHKDLCRARRTSQSWRAIATDLLHRGAFKRKTLEERVEFLLDKLQKQAKQQYYGEDRIRKEYPKEMLLHELDTAKILELHQIIYDSNEKLFAALLKLFIYAEDEIGLWDYFDEFIARSEDKLLFRSLLMTPYSKLHCHDLYKLNLHLMEDVLNKNANLNIEVDPTEGGVPENAANLVNVFKQYFDSLIPAIKNMNRSMVAWLQHIYKKFDSLMPVITILGLFFVTLSIIEQYDQRYGKGKKRLLRRRIARRERQHSLLTKMFATALIGMTHSEDFMSGANEYTLQAGEQMLDLINDLMGIEIDPSTLFHPVNFSVDEIFDALTVVKEHYNILMRINNNK